MTTIAEAAQTDYEARQAWLDAKAAEMSPTMPLSARVVRHYARLASWAAQAEQVDPDPPLAPCHVCRGIRTCDLEFHRSLR